MNVDYIIVGAGLAGIAFSETLLQNGKSFIVIDDSSQQSSSVAAGLYNPVLLKRFTKVWKAKEQLEFASTMYASIEQKLDVKLDYKLPIYRLFASIEEQNNWFQSCDDHALRQFMSSELILSKFKNIQSEFGFGEVLQSGRIDTALLTASYKDYLKRSNLLIEESFEYNNLEAHDNKISYKSFEASHIIFAEGYGLDKNPFFSKLPLDGTKGELLKIHAPDLKLNFVLKSSVFIIPLGNDLYRVGSTYNWSDKSNEPTTRAKEELVWKLKKIIKCEFQIREHLAGIRPTVNDRRPLVGRHHEYGQMYVLNGLGTRGVMIGPYVANQLFQLIHIGKELDNEINIRRFD